MKEKEKKSRTYVKPLSVVVSANMGCHLLSGSVNGDHESADDDESYAKQANWGLQDLDETDWEDDDVVY